jgi:hypothetical protein
MTSNLRGHGLSPFPPLIVSVFKHRLFPYSDHFTLPHSVPVAAYVYQ